MKSNQKLGSTEGQGFKHIQSQISAESYQKLRLLAFVKGSGDLTSIIASACQEYIEKHWKSVKDLVNQ